MTLSLDLLQSSKPGQPRQTYCFSRTVCGCALCQAPCRHIPGSLDVTDLLKLCPSGQDIFKWAEEHLRAIVDKGYPTLVPARGLSGACHWLFEGRCAVHAAAPYSCAFFDAHMTEPEILARSQATIAARRQDQANRGLYYRVWTHLCGKNLLAPSGNRAALAADIERLRTQMS
ncbi:hypothetical protein BH10PLA2_BH10PLA2_18960 [soil metagenome]